TEYVKRGNVAPNNTPLTKPLSDAVYFVHIAGGIRHILSEEVYVPLIFDEAFRHPSGVLITLQNHAQLTARGTKSMPHGPIARIGYLFCLNPPLGVEYPAAF